MDRFGKLRALGHTIPTVCSLTRTNTKVRPCVQVSDGGRLNPYQVAKGLKLISEKILTKLGFLGNYLSIIF